MDGYRIVEDLAPRGLRLRLQQFEQWSIFIFLMLVFIPPLRDKTITPLFKLIEPIVFNFSRTAAYLVGM